MKLKPLLTMGSRNLWLHRKRQTFLLSALIICFALISLMTALSEGMSFNVYQASRIHYGGDLFMVGHYGGHVDKPAWVQDPEILEDISREIPGQWVKRSLLFKRAWLYFNGTPQLIKNVVGLDMQAEIEHLDHYAILQGSREALLQPGSIALSSKLAGKMGIQPGDSITLKTTNPTGQVGTGDLVVAALLDDNTLLGYYRIYMHRSDLNRILGWDPEDFSSLSLFLDDPDQTDVYVNKLSALLAEKLPTGGAIGDRDSYYREIYKNWKGIRYFVYGLGVYISEVDSLLQALDLVSYFVYLMMLAISLVSVLVTYRIILHDRSRELAMFQAMGMTAWQVEAMLMIEASIMLILALSAGFILSLLLMAGLGQFSFDWIPGFGIFLKQGRLTGKWTMNRILVNISVILLGVVPAVWYQVRKELKKPLNDTLAGGKH